MKVNFGLLIVNMINQQKSLPLILYFLSYLWILEWGESPVSVGSAKYI